MIPEFEIRDRHIYMDNAATTVIDQSVVEVMVPFLQECYGNPETVYDLGREAHVAVERAREQVATLLGCKPTEVFFTSGGTESNNWAIKCSVGKGKYQICSTVEHASVLESMRHPANRTFPMDSIPVDSVGRIKLDDLQYIFKEHDEVALVSVQYGNNEVGTIQPVQEIAELCRENGTLFHTDACQAFGKVPFDVEEMGIDMASVSAHKIHGPMGIGALYVKEGTNLKPLLHGGGQENGMRSGTLAVPLIVGFGKAVEMAQTHLKGMKRIYRMVSTMATKLEHIGATRNGDPENRLPHILSVSFPDLPGASLVGALNKMGICVAMGSACRTRKNQSHVLEALGIDYLTNNHTIRISPSRYTEDIDAHGLVRAIQQIRRNPGELEYL